jgi:hypothetical protein
LKPQWKYCFFQGILVSKSKWMRLRAFLSLRKKEQHAIKNSSASTRIKSI